MKPGPAERAMAIRNREIIAERCGWPAGILATCVELERRHPGWDVSWMRENTIRGFEREAGFAATRLAEMSLDDSDDLRPGRPHQQPRVFASDPVELAERIAMMEERVAAEQEAERRRWTWTGASWIPGRPR